MFQLCLFSGLEKEAKTRKSTICALEVQSHKYFFGRVYMSLYLRIVLILISSLSFIYILSKVRKSKVKVDFTFFWILFSLFLLLLSIFPKIADLGAKLVGIISPLNFVLLLIIFLLLYKVFTLTLQFSNLQQRFEQLVQTLALKEKNNKDELKG